MDNNSSHASSLLRMVGVMGIGVGAAWALQILAIDPTGSPLDRLMWVLAAASVCGASFGLIVVSGLLGYALPADANPGLVRN